MDDQEALLLSAKGCGYTDIEFDGQRVWVSHSDLERDDGTTTLWNPPENAEQNWECVEELLRREYKVIYDFGDGTHEALNKRANLLGHVITRPASRCAPKDFAYRALAELVRREK